MVELVSEMGVTSVCRSGVMSTCSALMLFVYMCRVLPESQTLADGRVNPISNYVDGVFGQMRKGFWSV